MRKIAFVCLLLILITSGASAQSAGGGISFFFPQSLLDGKGSVSKEAGLSTSLGLGESFSIPIGFTYIKASGFQGYKDTDNDGGLNQLDEDIWYIADTFIPYIRLKTHINEGLLFVEAFGGIAGAWIVAPQTFDGAVGRYYGGADGGEYYVFRKLESDISFGLGYQLGTTVGFRIDALSIGIEGVFTDLKADTKISSEEGWFYNGTTTEINNFSETFTSRLRGISIGITGSYEL